jgi:hypothetical protein
MPRSTSSRRSPTLAATLTAAALAGELVVATLVIADDARAQVDDPRAPGTSAAPEAPEPPPVEAPDDAPVDVPPEVPAARPVEPPAVEPPALEPPALEPPAADVPGLPSAPTPPALPPVRTGHTAAAPVADAAGGPPAAPRTARTGHDGRDPEAVAGPRRTGRDGRAPHRLPRMPGRRDAAEHQRPRRRGAPRPVTGASAVEGALPSRHTIAPGEHLWGIAAVRLGAATGRDPASIPVEDVAPYWTRLCMTNAPHLRSGNVSLVYPGEVIELPPA